MTRPLPNANVSNDIEFGAEGVLAALAVCVVLVALLALCGQKSASDHTTPTKKTEAGAGHRIDEHQNVPNQTSPPRPDEVAAEQQVNGARPTQPSTGGLSDTIHSDNSQTTGGNGFPQQHREATVEETMRTLRQICDDLDGALHPQCRLHKDTIRAGMHAAVAEVTNRFKTQVTAVFFPDQTRMDRHMRMYQRPGIKDFMPIISEQRNANSLRDNEGSVMALPGHFFVDRCQTLREAMAQCITQRDFLHELFTVCQHLTRQLVIMHRRKIVLRDICLRNVVRTNLGQVRSWTFLEYAGAVRCGTRTESMQVRTTPPEVAKARLEGKPTVHYSYDMWQLGVFVYELSTGEPYWSPRMTDGQVLQVLSTPSKPLPHESNPVSIDLVNRILKQLLTRDENTRLDSVALKALLDHEEETGTLSSTMNSTLNPVPQPNVVLEGIGHAQA